MRVALYCRVSHEEQVKHGISIDAQVEALHNWANDNGHTIVGEYIDLGVSARKSPSKRPALQQLLSDIPTKQTELIAFTKLDRWTRNVAGYYQVQEILDKHNVAWNAILERYETETVNGRFLTNVMLSVSEQEADRVAERIKTVFDHKVIMGEAITGALPLGLKIENKHIVPDDNAPAVKAVFEHYAMHGNKQGARNMLHDEYGICLPHLTISHMLTNTLYKGEYRGNTKYCDPIVSAELFDRVQEDLKRRSTWTPPTGRVYLFPGLLVCVECGHRLTVCTSGGKRTRYRCPNHYMMHSCQHYTSIREDALETQLLDYLSDQVASHELEYTRGKQKSPLNKKSIEEKLDRLKELYVDGDITKEKYISERDRLNSLLNEPKPAPTAPQKFIGKDFLGDYQKLDQTQKKAFWREMLDHVDIDTENHLYIYFR